MPSLELCESMYWRSEDHQADDEGQENGNDDQLGDRLAERPLRGIVH